MKYYAIKRKNGGYLAASRASNDGSDFCNSMTVALDHEVPDPLKAWHADEPERAQHTIQFPPPWYNSSDENPMHGYDADELSVVEIEVEVKETPVDVKIPTVAEYVAMAYGPEGRENNPGHYAYVMTQVDAGRMDRYGWADYWILRHDLEHGNYRGRKKKKAH